ncbi:unnamed protein product [Coccothraustes coccothraustes]
MERASIPRIACLCRGSADEDVGATEMPGESHEQASGTARGTPEPELPGQRLPGGPSLPVPQGHCREGQTLMSPNQDTLLLAGTGRAPVPAVRQRCHLQQSPRRRHAGRA